MLPVLSGDRSLDHSPRICPFCSRQNRRSSTTEIAMYIAAVNKRSDATVKNKFKREATPPKMSLTRVKAFATARMCRERTVYNHRYVASAHARLNALFNSKDFGFSYVIKYTLITA